jgi:phosphoribosylamine-glycine ligase
MTQQDYRHPITPPPELSDEQVGEWLIDDGYPWDPSEQAVITITTNRLKNVARQAFQAGADQELEACCEYVYERLKVTTVARIAQELRAARRPKPPSLKEQALQALSEAVKMADDVPPEGICSGQADIIRHALEQLPDNH